MMTQMQTTLRRYRTQVALAAILLFAVVAGAGIYFFRQLQAPTAPTSRPNAENNVCTTDFLIQPDCLAITPSTAITQGASVSFICQGQNGTTSYKFQYRTSATGVYQDLAAGATASSSAALTVGTYLDAKCTPCAGVYCATDTVVAAKCSVNYATTPVSPAPSPIPSVIPSPVPSPAVSPTPSPTTSCNAECLTNSDCLSGQTCSAGRCRNPACTDSTSCTCGSPPTGFVIQKFHDHDGDGSKESGDEGLDWSFQWQLNDDGNWRDYTTTAGQDGRGGTIGNLHAGDKVEIREVAKSGWTATTNSTITLTMEDNQVKLAQFGNRQPTASPVPGSPRPIVSPTPQELPVTGSAAQTAGLFIIGLAIMGFGVSRLLLKK